MYTDFRFCKFCSDNGYYMDGENYCSQCKEYLCLKCTRTHGQTCQQPDQQTFENTATKINDNGRIDMAAEKRLETVHNSKGSSKTGYASNSVITKQFVQVSRNGSGRLLSGNTNHNQETSTNRSSAVDRNIWTGYSEVNRTALPSRAQFKQDENKRGDVIRIANNNKREHFSDFGGVIRTIKAWPDVKQNNFEGQTILACPCHPEMNLENVCINHNSLCCVECMNKQHQQCAFQPIDEIAHSMNSENELQKMNGRVDELNNLCDSVLYKQQLCLQNINTSSVSALQPTKQILSQSNLRVSTERNISACRDIQQNISICRQELNNAATSNNKIRLFIALHKTKTTIENLNRNLQAIANQTTQVGQNSNSATALSVVKMDTKTGLEKPMILSNNRSSVATLNDCVKSGSGDKLFEKSSKIMDNPRQNSFVIGDVILSPCEDPEAHINDKHDIQDNNDFYSSDDDVDIVLDNKVTEVTKLKPAQQKSAGFVHKDVNSRTNTKDKIKSHGLVTDYYLKQITNITENDEDILRLYSPEPEETGYLYSEKRYINLKENKPTGDINKPKLEHKETDRNRNMIKWQDKKLLESVEHRKESDTKETTIRSSCQGRPKKIFESSENELKVAMSRDNSGKQKKIVRLHKTRQENGNVNRNTKCSVKQKRVHKDKRTTSVRYAVETDASRLQKWIKQTEDMNKIHHQSQVSRTLQNKDLTLSGLYNVLEANDDNFKCSEANSYELPPFMTMKLKNARLMNNTRVSSAKSQASDSDESKHKKQMFVDRPRYELSLCAEYGVRLSDDSSKCLINGISCLPDGRIAVTDYNNKNIKLFRIGWSKPSVLQLEEPPHDVTSVSHTLMAAIAGLAFDRMYLVSVGQCMAVNKRFKTGCECKAVSSFESNIYLLCLFRYETEVRVLNTDGVVSMRLAFGHSISIPIDIAINQSNGIMFITDKTNGVYKCSSSGGIQSRSFDSNIGVYQKVTCDSNNSVFVCSQDPSGINELSKDGRYIMPVVPNAGILGVNALAYNEISNCLVAGCNKTQTVRIYNILDCL